MGMELSEPLVSEKDRENKLVFFHQQVNAHEKQHLLLGMTTVNITTN